MSLGVGLLYEHRFFWLRARRSGGGRDREGEPGVPARCAILGPEFFVAFYVHITLQVAHRNDVADLRADAEHLHLETAELRAGSAVATDLPVGVTDKTKLQLLGDEF